jgi:hypothetical protein
MKLIIQPRRRQSHRHPLRRKPASRNPGAAERRLGRHAAETPETRCPSSWYESTGIGRPVRSWSRIQSLRCERRCIRSCITKPVRLTSGQPQDGALSTDRSGSLAARPEPSAGRLCQHRGRSGPVRRPPACPLTRRADWPSSAPRPAPRFRASTWSASGVPSRFGCPWHPARRAAAKPGKEAGRFRRTSGRSRSSGRPSYATPGVRGHPQLTECAANNAAALWCRDCGRARRCAAKKARSASASHKSDSRD